MATPTEEQRPLFVRQESRIDQRRKKVKQWACAAILGTETLERIAFYGVTGNLVLFLSKTPFEWMSYNSANGLFVFMGLSFVLCLFEGWLADAVLGRFKMIFIFFFFYLGGYVLLPLLYPYPELRKNDTAELPGLCPSSVKNETNPMNGIYSIFDNWTDILTSDNTRMVSPGEEKCAPIVFLSLVLMAIGSASCKTNIAAFGGDQVKSEGPEAGRSFFNWFYWSVNIGSFIALGPIAYVQQEISFFWGYLAPCVCLFLSMIVFCAGAKFYLARPHGGSAITNVFRVIFEACSMKRKRRKRQQSYRTIDTAGSSSDAEPKTLLDFAKSRYGGSFHDKDVEEVQTLGKTVLIFLTMIPYWIGYYQMETNFLTQGLHMRLSLPPMQNISGPNTDMNDTPRNFQIPAAWLTLFDVIFVIIFIPIMNRIVYPKLDKMNRPLLLKHRIAIGMGVSVLSMICAGVVENQRLAIYWRNGTQHPLPQNISNTTFYAADMSIAWQIPQYALIGIGEVFASIGGIELAYSLSPKSMQGLLMGLFYFVSGVGSFLGTATMAAFQGVWFFTGDHGNINCRLKCNRNSQEICRACHLDYYFFFLAGIQVFGLILYLVLTRKLRLGNEPWRRRFNPSNSINPRQAPTPSSEVTVRDSKHANGAVRKKPEKALKMNYTT